MVTDTAESTETHKGIVNVDFHAASLRENGYTVIAAPVVGEELVERARVQCRDRLADLLDKVKAAGCDPLEQQYRFKEIAKRYDMDSMYIYQNTYVNITVFRKSLTVRRCARARALSLQTAQPLGFTAA